MRAHRSRVRSTNSRISFFSFGWIRDGGTLAAGVVVDFAFRAYVCTIHDFSYQPTSLGSWRAFTLFVVGCPFPFCSLAKLFGDYRSNLFDVLRRKVMADLQQSDLLPPTVDAISQNFRSSVKGIQPAHGPRLGTEMSTSQCQHRSADAFFASLFRV